MCPKYQKYRSNNPPCKSLYSHFRNLRIRQWSPKCSHPSSRDGCSDSCMSCCLNMGVLSMWWPSWLLVVLLLGMHLALISWWSCRCQPQMRSRRSIRFARGYSLVSNFHQWLIHHLNRRWMTKIERIRERHWRNYTQNLRRHCWGVRRARLQRLTGWGTSWWTCTGKEKWMIWIGLQRTLLNRNENDRRNNNERRFWIEVRI